VGAVIDDISLPATMLKSDKEIAPSGVKSRFQETSLTGVPDKLLVCVANDMDKRIPKEMLASHWHEKHKTYSLTVGTRNIVARARQKIP
jgi:hypothetical protein